MTTQPQPSRPDLGTDLVRCMWRAMEAESSMPRTDAAARVIADIFAQEVDLLRSMLDEHGWPGHRLVGERGSRAAWQIATYCGDDALQARACDLLEKAVRQQDADPLHYALLADRLCLNRGEPQRFGTLYIPTHSGVLELYRVGEPERLDDRRHALGLEPHAAYARNLRADVLSPDVTSPPS
ncbi:hypothetical protein O1Q96_09615 [Streptomyces sp. Qhu-G9]|uniref:DUF6624 domain-containing protein n=1 Tax=Streptomyces sp. Qhu-G9 TaxID=3452799 RepID=UPI0022ABCE05|nr:DUF6624 domain-containing protein [Streptomyces aurantiacus]WAU79975.1 hypothetical protein O1Q96_09615 [Streptomyces aurantiacus]